MTNITVVVDDQEYQMAPVSPPSGQRRSWEVHKDGEKLPEYCVHQSDSGIFSTRGVKWQSGNHLTPAEATAAIHQRIKAMDI